jgi:hypothetical protein
MIWATMVGVDGGQQRATMWVMLWTMMWATGMMAVTMPATTSAKRDGEDTGREGGGDPGGGRGGGGGSGNGCILQESFAFYYEDIFVWYFYDVWGELARLHLPSHSRHA